MNETNKLNARLTVEHDFPSIITLPESELELFQIAPTLRYPLTDVQLRAVQQQRVCGTSFSVLDQLIGYANLYEVKPNESCFIGHVMLASAWRGHGLGRQIVEYMMACALENFSVKKIHISVFSFNTPALLLYASLGFLPYKCEERIYQKNQRVALLHMLREVTKC